LLLRVASGLINSKWHFSSQQKIQGFFDLFGKRALTDHFQDFLHGSTKFTGTDREKVGGKVCQCEKFYR